LVGTEAKQCPNVAARFEFAIIAHEDNISVMSQGGTKKGVGNVL